MTLCAKTEREISILNGEKKKVWHYGDESFGTKYGMKRKAPIYGFEALDWLIARMNAATKKHWDQITLITGLERSGKSSLGFHIAERLDPDFPLEHVAFTASEAIKMIDQLEVGDTAILDEAGFALFSEEWMQQEQRNLVKLFQIFGIKEMKVILILPHRKLLNVNLRNRRIHWWFHTYAMGYDRGYARLRESVPNEWEIETWFEPVFTLKFPRYEGPKWDAYTKRKWEFVSKGVSEELAKKEKTYQSKLFNMLWVMAKEHQFTNQQLADMTGYDGRAMASIMKLLEKKKIGGGVTDG